MPGSCAPEATGVRVRRAATVVHGAWHAGKPGDRTVRHAAGGSRQRQSGGNDADRAAMASCRSDVRCLRGRGRTQGQEDEAVTTQVTHDDRSAQSSATSPAGQAMAAQLTRRGLLAGASGVAAATATAVALGGLPTGAAALPAAEAAGPAVDGRARADQAYAIRVNAARTQRAHPLPA